MKQTLIFDLKKLCYKRIYMMQLEEADPGFLLLFSDTFRTGKAL